MDDPILVGEGDLERELALARVAVRDPTAGLFGPASLMWRVDREAVLFLGARRALLLQLAHPWIATCTRSIIGARARKQSRILLGLAASGFAFALTLAASMLAIIAPCSPTEVCAHDR